MKNTKYLHVANGLTIWHAELVAEKDVPFIPNKSYPKINLTPSPQSKSENLIFRLEYKNTHPPIISVWLLRKQNFTYIISLSRKLFVNPRLWQNQNFYVSYLPIILNSWLIFVILKDKFRNFLFTFPIPAKLIIAAHFPRRSYFLKIRAGSGRAQKRRAKETWSQNCRAGLPGPVPTPVQSLIFAILVNSSARFIFMNLI